MAGLPRMTRLLPVGLVLAATACSFGGDRIYATQTYRPNPASHLMAAGESRDITTIVAGNPFGTSPATLASVVVAGLQSAFPNARLRFVTQPGEGTRRGVVYIVVFDAAPGAGPNSICARQGRVATAPSPDAVNVAMAFCHGREPLVAIRARLDRAAGLGDQAFVRLIRDMAQRMFGSGDPRL